jgi:hypothetical protein
MAVNITGADAEHLGKKLEAFSATLNDSERTLFKGMLEGGRLQEADLEKVTGGTSLNAPFATTVAPALNAKFFHGVMCW